jgi:AraC-like DNA-binding protein
MGFHSRKVLFSSDIALVSDFCCRHPIDPVGFQMESEGDNITFVRSGVFGRVRGKNREIADSAHILFFAKGHSYRFFHPVNGGDTSTIFTPTREFLFETFGTLVRDRHLQGCLFDLPPLLASPRNVLLCNELLAAIRNRAPLLSVEETLTELLADTCQMAWDGTSKRPFRQNGRVSRRHDLAEETKVLLNRRIEARPTLSEIANILNCSKFYLSRIFAEECGISIRRYFIRLRLHAAAQRIAEGASDLTSLALDLGFCDHSHLTKMFMREFGVQPSVFCVRALSKTAKTYKRALKLPG